MPSKIPLLRLPLLPFEQILDSLNLKDLIELSLFSKQMYNRIHCQLVRFNDVRLSVISVHEYYDNVQLTSDQFGLFWIESCYEKKDEGCLQALYSKERIIGHDEAKYNKFQKRVWDRANRKDDFLFWVRYLKELFNVTTYSSISLWFKVPTDFDRYFKRNNLLFNAEKIEIVGDIPMSHEELEFLLDNLTANKLRIELPLMNPGSFQYKKKIRFPHLKMPDFSWLSEDQLLDLLATTKKIEVKNTKVLTESFLNKFLKQWLNSSNDTLKKVEIWSKPYSEPSEIPVFDEKKVLEGVKGLVMTDYFDDDSEEEILERGITISRDKNTALTFRVTTRMDSLFFQCSFREWRCL